VDLVNLIRGEPNGEGPRQTLSVGAKRRGLYCFWLKGEEDFDPPKRKQYKRWRE